MPITTVSVPLEEDDDVGYGSMSYAHALYLQPIIGAIEFTELGLKCVSVCEQLLDTRLRLPK